jgi:hypothetical protein
MKSSVLYIHNNRIIIHAESRTKAGFWIADEPYILLNNDTPIDKIVNSIKECLNNSRDKVPTPTNWPAYEKKYHENLEIKSLKEFKKYPAKLVHINLDKKTITFIPTKNGPDRVLGFTNKAKETVQISFDSNNEEIYSFLKIALDRCE